MVEAHAPRRLNAGTKDRAMEGFRDFCFAHLGSARLLARCGGVVDVGGGDGELAALFCRSGVPATLVDPCAPRDAPEWVVRLATGRDAGDAGRCPFRIARTRLSAFLSVISFPRLVWDRSHFAQSMDNSEMKLTDELLSSCTFMYPSERIAMRKFRSIREVMKQKDT